jgi:replicative DNA helicase
MRRDLEYEPLPESSHIEMAILGAILLDNEIFFSQGAADLKVNDFAFDSHQRIFRMITNILFGMVEGVEVADTITVGAELKNRRELETVGGLPYIFHLTEGIPRNFNIESYVVIVREKARLRTLMGIFHDAGIRASDQSEDAEKIVADVQNQLTDEKASGDGKAVRIGDVGPEIERQIEAKRSISTDKTALSLTWGIPKMDEFTKGAHEGEVTVLSGESGGGKTIAAIQMALVNAKEGTPCAIFSMEMSKEKLVNRFYPQMSPIITADMMRDPRLINLHTHIPEIHRVSEELVRLPIWIDDSVSLDINVLVARIRMMRRKYGIRLGVIDYLQLITNKAKREGTESLVDIMFKLRDLVKIEPTLHLLLLSQYSKGDNFTKRRRRTRNDLLGSSSIHQAAQNVLLLTIEDEEKKDKNDLLDVEFRFDKQRDGRKGRVTTYFDRAHLCYREPEAPLTTYYTQQQEEDDF